MKQALALIVATALVAGCSGSKDQGEPPAELQPISAELKVKRVWSAKLGSGSESLNLGLAPATDGTLIFAASRDGTVSAFQAEGGQRVWRTKLASPLAAGPGYGDGVVVVGSSNGDLVALTAADGGVRWTLDVGSEVLARPLITRDLVIARTVDGRLFARSALNGGLVWSVARDVPTLSLRGNSAPFVIGDRIIAGFDDGKVLGLALRTGEEIWQISLTAQRGRTEIERLADIDADVRAVGNDIYVVGFQSRAAMLAVESGQLMWTSELSSFEAPGVDWLRLYITDDASEVVALDRTSGGPLWRQNALRMRALTGPTPHGQAVVVGDFEGYLHWLSNADGRLIGRTRVGSDAVTRPPLVVGELLYVQTEGGTLSAYRVEDRSS